MAAGCGLSMRASGECVRVILESGLLAVLDADALNLIARDASLRQLLHSSCAQTKSVGTCFAERTLLLSLRFASDAFLQ